MKVSDDIRRVAVIGCGTIGAGWTTLFLAKGLEVVIADPSEDAEASLRGFVRAAWPQMISLGVAEGASYDRVYFARSVEEACSDVDFIQENAPEREAVKVALYAEMDGASQSNVVIASSSSALMVTKLQRRCRHPERIVLGHPFNPPHLMPLVEIVGGEATSRAALDAAIGFYSSLGKTAVHLKKEVPGHVANRLQAAVFREAVYLLDEGVASIGDIDRIMTNGPGLRWALMGPFLTYHLAGGAGGMEAFMKQFAPMQTELWEALGHPHLDSRLQHAVTAAMGREVSGTTVDALSMERDDGLITTLKARRHGMRNA